MTIKGVTGSEQKIIDNILQLYKDKYEFYYYGSRVKGNFRFLSDLDILIKGDVSPDDLDTMRMLFDKSRLPYVVNFSYDVDEKFYNLIKDDLVKV